MAKKPDPESPTSQATDSDPEFTAALAELKQVADLGAQEIAANTERLAAAIPAMVRAALAERDAQVLNTDACDVLVPKGVEESKVAIETAKAAVESARTAHAAASAELATCEARLRELDAMDLQEMEHALEERNATKRRERLAVNVREAAAAVTAAEQGVRDAEQSALVERQMYLQARLMADEDALAQWARAVTELVSRRLGAHESLVKQEHSVRAAIERGSRGDVGQPSSITLAHHTHFTSAVQHSIPRGDNVLAALGKGLRDYSNGRTQQALYIQASLAAADNFHGTNASSKQSTPWRGDAAATENALRKEVDARRASRTPSGAPRAADYDPYKQ